MKKTITALLFISIIALLAYGFYNKLTVEQVTQDPYEAKIQAIMQRPEFIKSIRLQAETVQAKEDKQDAEKRLEGFRKAELELASSTKQLVL